MAKVKVLDLAREVGMEDDKLVQKLKKMGVKMKDQKLVEPEKKASALDEKVIERDADKEVVEKRVKPTVIRRRARTIEAPAEAPAPAPAMAEAAAPEVPVPEPKAVKAELGAESQIRAQEQKEIQPKTVNVKKKAEESPVPSPIAPEVRAEAEIVAKAEIKVEEAKEVRAEAKPEPRKEEKEAAKVQPTVPPKKEAKKEAPGISLKDLKITVPDIKIVDDEEKAGKEKAGLLTGKKKGFVKKKKLIGLGVLVNINQVIDADVASLAASEFGYEVEKVSLERQELLERKEDLPEQLKPRPPVVTIMGHVDHGKTMLLDSIRKTNVVEGEAGGITQHIGAYDVQLENGQVVFIDTPGHEAFTAMRARGAKVTDVVVLVVAADDGMMPQTKEAIDHSRAANVPIVVAINKIDKPNSNPEKVKKELSEYGLIPENWGGTTLFAEVSAKQKTGIKELLDLILLQAEVLELKANPDKPARGTIIEAKLDKGRGPVATLLVQEGTLKPGDAFIAGPHYGRVRAMLDDKGKKIEMAKPSAPVEVVGFSDVPEAGDPFIVVSEERIAKQISLYRQEKIREKELAKLSKVSLEDLYERIKKGEVKELNVIIKADVQGSIEAVKEALKKLSTDQVKVNVLHDAVGGITETDVNLASASNAIIIGFNVRPGQKAQALAEQEHVDVRTYSIIYDAVTDVKKALEGLLEPTFKEHLLGRAQVVQVFNIHKVGTVAGSLVVDGKVVKGSHARLLRDNVIVFDGKIISLRRFKDDVKDCANGLECGIGIENFNDIKLGDVIESYEMEKVQPHL